MMKRWLLVILVFGFWLSTLLARQITVDVKLVTLVTTVTDSAGRHIPDLQPQDFIVEEDGQPQTVTLLEQSNDVPVSMGVVLDTSTSMETKITTATSAIDRFLQTLEPEDDIFLMSFASGIRLEQDFTNDRKKLTSAMRRVKLSSGTALYDAVEKSLRKIRDGHHDKKAILLVTDGVDTASLITFNDAVNDVRASEVLVYCLGISPEGLSGVPTRVPTQTIPQPIPQPRQGGPTVGRPGGTNGGPTNGPVITLPGGIQIPLPGPARRQFPGGNSGGGRNLSLDTVDMDVLNSIANSSGGKAWLITSNAVSGGNSQLDNALDEIAAELRSQYTIGYHPTHPMNDGKWHRVEVRMKDSRYTARSRKEYFGGENPGK
jgi:Ca-activated chloride channel homolog